MDSKLKKLIIKNNELADHIYYDHVEDMNNKNLLSNYFFLYKDYQGASDLLLKINKESFYEEWIPKLPNQYQQYILTKRL